MLFVEVALLNVPLPGEDVQVTLLAPPPNDDPDRFTVEPLQIVVVLATAETVAAVLTVMSSVPDMEAEQVGAALYAALISVMVVLAFKVPVLAVAVPAAPRLIVWLLPDPIL